MRLVFDTDGVPFRYHRGPDHLPGLKVEYQDPL